MLAALLLNANHVVPADELVGTLWGMSPPPSARVALRNYVKRLRHELGNGGQDRIHTRPGGYLISVDPDELDVSRFDALLRAARAAARDGQWDQAAGQATAALSLWRGVPLADVESDELAQREVPRLTEVRLQALETRIEADLHRGDQASVIAELRSLTAAYPLREQLHGQLMLALFQCGRQAEALAAYQDARRVLIDEVGTEPGTGLRQLHQRILIADPLLAAGPGPGPAAARPAPAGPARPGRPVPRQLPAPVRHFTGRHSELASLTGLLGEPGTRTPEMVIAVIGGTAGVGKTALALHWAHQVAARFPDGQLYINLRGYDSGHPMSAAEALAAFLRALGLPGQEIPAELDERAARYRGLLAGRRVLVVLDNAGEAEQVRPLLPGAPTCAALVTSRDSLPSLVARDGAQRLDLDLLPLADAVALLRALIGERAHTDQAATNALASRCCRLPLALRVAAELTASRPAMPLAGLVDELADEHRRLDLLEAGGDPRTEVRAVFSWSYQHLDTETAQAFRRLSLHPGTDLDIYAAAALTGATLEQAGRALGLLVRGYLIQPTGRDRYSMHDLLRAYVREHATQQDCEDEQRAALTRLFDHYLSAAAAAMDMLHPAEHPRRPSVGPSVSPIPPAGCPAAARDWLDAQRSCLVTVTAYTAANGWPGHAIRLAAILFRYLEAGGHAPEGLIIHGHALRAARQAGDQIAEADALNSLGVVHWGQGRHQRAAGFLRQALALYRAAGDRLGQARVLGNLDLVDIAQCRYRQAEEHSRRALALYREAGDRLGEARALSDLAQVNGTQGHYPQAISQYRRALALFRAVGDRGGEARMLGNLGEIQLKQGDYQSAADHQRQALALCQETGYRIGEAYALHNLGCISMRWGCYQQAVEQHRQALTLYRETGDRSGEAAALAQLGRAELSQRDQRPAADHLRQALDISREIGDLLGEAVALNGLGEVSLAAGRPHEAHAHHAAALTVASQVGDVYEQARGHDGLARAHHGTTEPEQARQHWQEALALYTRLGAPEADEVRGRLLMAANGQPPSSRS